MFDLFYIINFVLGIGAGLYIPAVIPLSPNIMKKELGQGDRRARFGRADQHCRDSFLALLLLLFLPWRGIFLVLGLALLCCAAIFYVNSEEIHTLGSQNISAGNY
jgi:hypothetical protein